VPRQIAVRRVFLYLGIGLTLTSVAFLGHGLHRQFGDILNLGWNASDLLILICAMALYAMGLFILAFSWALMLHEYKDLRQQILTSVVVYTSASILKYLPGNFLHFVGRNVVGHSSDRRQGPMAAATVLEIGFSLLSALFLSALVFSFSPAPFSHGLFRVIALALTALVVTILFRPRLFIRVIDFLPSFLLLQWLPRNIDGAMMSNMVAFACIMSAAALLSLVVLPGMVSPALIAALFIFAWLVGFIVPGAPSGLGVREALLVMELAPLTGEAEAFAFALTMRLVTTGGDIALYFGGLFIGVVMNMRRTS